MSILYQCDNCLKTEPYSEAALPQGWVVDADEHYCSNCAAEEDESGDDNEVE